MKIFTLLGIFKLQRQFHHFLSEETIEGSPFEEICQEILYPERTVFSTTFIVPNKFICIAVQAKRNLKNAIFVYWPKNFVQKRSIPACSARDNEISYSPIFNSCGPSGDWFESVRARNPGIVKNTD